MCCTIARRGPASCALLTPGEPGWVPDMGSQALERLHLTSIGYLGLVQRHEVMWRAALHATSGNTFVAHNTALLRGPLSLATNNPGSDRGLTHHRRDGDDRVLTHAAAGPTSCARWCRPLKLARRLENRLLRVLRDEEAVVHQPMCKLTHGGEELSSGVVEVHMGKEGVDKGLGEVDRTARDGS